MQKKSEINHSKYEDYTFPIEDMSEQEAIAFWQQLKALALSAHASDSLFHKILADVLNGIDEGDYASYNDAAGIQPLFITCAMEQVNSGEATLGAARDTLIKIASYQIPRQESYKVKLSEDVVGALQNILNLARKSGSGLGGLTSGDHRNLATLIESYDAGNKGHVELEVVLSDGYLELVSSPGKTADEKRAYLNMAKKMVTALSALCSTVIALYTNVGAKKALSNSGFITALQNATKNPCNNQVAHELKNCLEIIPRG